MQVNSINSMSFQGGKQYINKNDRSDIATEYGEYSSDMHNAIDAISELRGEFSSEDKQVKPKGILGVIGSVLFAAGASYFLTKKAYNGADLLIKKVKSDDLVKPILSNEKLVNAAQTVKGKLTSLGEVAKNAVGSKIPEAVRNNGIVKFLQNNSVTTSIKAFDPSTKVALAGATAGTIAASRVDGNNDGQSDMFQKGISWLDSVAAKAGKVVNVLKIVS